MNAPRIGGLFFGYGGLDMAVQQVLGGGLAWVSEIDPGTCKVIEYRYPGVPNHGDITAIDWTHVEPVDIVCAGFPCQDVSNAGRQAGLIHGTRTGLWHEVVRAIDTLRPGLVLLENVRGLLSARGDTSVEYELADAAVDLADRLAVWVADRRDRAIREGRTADVQHLTTRAHRLVGLRRRAVAHRRRCERRIVRAVGTVLGSLADLGYDAIWYGLRAADVGAPHGRWRIFILAYPEGESGRVLHGDSGAAADAGGEHGAEQWLAGPGEAASGRALGEPAGRDRTPLMPVPRATDGTKGGPNQRGSSGDLMLPSAVAHLLPTPTTQDGKNTAGPSQHDRNTRPLNTEVTLLPTPSVADSMDAHASGGGYNGQTNVTLTDAAQRQPDRWGQYATAIHRWETITRPAPAPTESGPKGSPRLAARFTEWMMGLPDGWITDVPGITRNEALKLSGNGVVPQQAAAALRLMLALLTRWQAVA